MGQTVQGKSYHGRLWPVQDGWKVECWAQRESSHGVERADVELSDHSTEKAARHWARDRAAARGFFSVDIFRTHPQR